MKITFKKLFVLLKNTFYNKTKQAPIYNVIFISLKFK
jgi:hypothetical protein